MIDAHFVAICSVVDINDNDNDKSKVVLNKYHRLYLSILLCMIMMMMIIDVAEETDVHYIVTKELKHNTHPTAE
jgi:hypothetical protein